MKKNKIALITGASSGIGKELARIHAQTGGDLIITARREKKLKSLKQELEKQYKVKVMIIVKDLSKQGAAEEIYNEIKGKKIVVDFLINNAGFGGRGKFHERKWQQDFAMINVNIVALTTLTRLFLADFVKRNKGRILNVSSTAALLPGGPLQAVYYSTKCYVTSYSYALAEELHDTNISVSVLMPGATETEFAKTSGMDKTALFNNAFTAKEVAKAGYNGMLKGKLDIVAGLTFSQKIMMKSIPFIPKKVLLKQIRQMQEV